MVSSPVAVLIDNDGPDAYVISQGGFGPMGPAGTGSTIAVRNEGELLGTAFTTVRFKGAGVVANDAGGGIADVLIEGAEGEVAVSATDVGAIGDGVADDHPALQDWLDLGGNLHLPKGEYYSSDNLLLRKHAIINGDGYGFDNRIVDGSATLGYENQPGSRIKFAAGKGFKIDNQTLLTTVAAVSAGGGPVATATQEGAMHSRISNIALIGAGTGAAATGLYSDTQVVLENVFCIKFTGKGFDISASSDLDDGNSEYGNASLSTLRNCWALNNGSHGFHLRGRDANVIALDTCNAFSNGGWGFNDDGLLGNYYANCHTGGNTSGSFRASSAVGFHVYDGCYIENDAGKLTSLTAACTVIGGSMANDTFHPVGSTAFILNVGQAIRGPVSGLNNRHATQTQAGLGRSPDTESRVALWWGDNLDAGGDNAWKLRRDFAHAGLWSLNYRNFWDVMEFITGSHAAYALENGAAPGFPLGHYMGSIETAPRLLPAASAAPASGGPFRAGDTVPNSAPAASGKWGWVCVTAGSPGTWKAFGAIDA